MNAALTLPRGLRHPTWYVPLLLPILPIFGAYGAADSDQSSYLLGAFAMLVLGILYSVGLAGWLDYAPRLVRKEVEQLRPAWMLGLFGAQAGLMFTNRNGLDQVLVIPPLMFALLAALSFGIEFQQRTMPSLLCAPIDRLRLWRVKMTVLGGALLSQVLVLVVSAMAGHGFLMNTNIAALAGFSLAFAYAAWATVPLWSLLTRNLLAGLVFAVAVPPIAFTVGGSLVEWITSPFGVMSDISIVTALTLTGLYLLAAPWLTWRRWLTLEAPDLPEREMSGLFLGWRRTLAARPATSRSWFSSLIGKELRLQTVTLIALAVGLLLTVLKPLVPESMVMQEYASLLITLFSVVSILLAGATAIAEERRLGTLDTHVLLPVSRTVQWLIKLLLASVIAAVAVGLIIQVVSPLYRTTEFYLQLTSILALFVFSFLASSATPNSLRALLLGIAFTGVIVATCYVVVSIGMSDTSLNSGVNLDQARAEPGPWLAQARTLSNAEAEALEDRVVPQFLPLLLTAFAIVGSSPLLLALAFSRHNFAHPSAAPRRLSLQFPLCVLTTLVAGAFIVGGSLWLRHRSITQEILIMARKEVQLVDRLSPAELQIRNTLRGNQLDEAPELITFRRRLPPGGLPPSVPPVPAAPGVAANAPGVHWATETRRLPFDPATRAILIRDGDVAEDIREALRQEGLAKGDPDLPTSPGRPPGPWPGDDPKRTGGFQMGPEMMRRYGLTPGGGRAIRASATPSANPQPPTDVAPSPAGNPPQPVQMSPELMKRYGLTPPTATTAVQDTNAPVPALPIPETP